MQFTPPIYQKFGSSADDLLKKKLDEKEKHEVVVKTQSKGVSFTQTMNTKAGKLDELEGKMNIKYEDKTWGEATVEANTIGAISKEVKLTQVAPGLTITGKIGTNVNGKEALAPQIALLFKKDAFAGQLEYIYKSKKALGSFAVGLEGFSVGGLFTVDVNKLTESSDISASTNLDGGIQYEDRAVTAALNIQNSNIINFSIFHNLNKDTQFAAKLWATTEKNKANSIAVGCQHKLSPDTIVKGKAVVADDYSYGVGSNVEHKLVSPNVVVGVTTFYDSKKSAPTFGVSAQFSGI